jgi:hypothetical protein
MILQKIPDCPGEQMEKIVQKIGIQGDLQDLKGSPNIFLQAPYFIGSKSEYQQAIIKMDSNRVATFSGTIIAPTPYNSTNTSDPMPKTTDILNAAGSSTAGMKFFYLLLSTVIVLVFIN